MEASLKDEKRGDPSDSAIEIAIGCRGEQRRRLRALHSLALLSQVERPALRFGHHIEAALSVPHDRRQLSAERRQEHFSAFELRLVSAAFIEVVAHDHLARELAQTASQLNPEIQSFTQ